MSWHPRGRCPDLSYQAGRWHDSRTVNPLRTVNVHMRRLRRQPADQQVIERLQGRDRINRYRKRAQEDAITLADQIEADHPALVAVLLEVTPEAGAALVRELRRRHPSTTSGALRTATEESGQSSVDDALAELAVGDWGAIDLAPGDEVAAVKRQAAAAARRQGKRLVWHAPQDDVLHFEVQAAVRNA